jgi:hypothetical protein
MKEALLKIPKKVEGQTKSSKSTYVCQDARRRQGKIKMQKLSILEKQRPRWMKVAAGLTRGQCPPPVNRPGFTVERQLAMTLAALTIRGCLEGLALMI